VIRGTPLLVQLVLIYTGLAAVGLYQFHDVGLLGMSLKAAVQAAIIGLMINESAYIAEIIRAGLEAPSGYNIQPWRFVVVRDAEQKKRLRQAAFGQPKVEQASAVIVACGDPQGWKDGDLDEMRQGRRQ